MNEINARIERLEAELDELKRSVLEPEIEVASTRRDILRKVTIGAAGAAIGAAALARPAAAANGDFIKIGTEGGPFNTGTLPTTVTFVSASTTGVGFLFETGTTYASSDAAFPSALAGWAAPNGQARNGVYGFSEFGDHAGVVGFGALGTVGTIGGRFFGTRSALNILKNGTLASHLTLAHVKGDIFATDEGDLWYVAADGTPGTLRKLGGPTTAGQLHLLAAPVRVYDSRPGKAPIVGGDGALSGANRIISLSTGFVGAIATPAVPNGATGALVSVTLDATTSSGFLAVFSNDVADVSSSNLNWFASGQILAVTTVSAVDATAKIKVKAGGGGATQIIVDVIGYYR